MPQKTMTEITPPPTKTETKLPTKIELTEPPTPKPVTITTSTLPPIQPPPQMKPQPPTQHKQEYKPIPPEFKILLDALEEFEGIAYAARNKIYQLYGPVDYQAQNSTKPRNLEDIRMSFPEEIEIRLDFIEQDDKYILKAKQFLGSEMFAKVMSAVRGMGGQYISAGKDSHFEIRKF
jgi:hypothetical protein